MLNQAFDDILDAFEDEKRGLHYMKGDAITKQDLNLKPVFSFAYLNTEVYPKSKFCEDCFDKEDYKIYIQKLKYMSNKTIIELKESNYKEHFHIIDQPNKKLREVLSNVLGRNINNDILSTIGQFGLYTSENDNEKSPRIFFFIGKLGVIHILFYDPCHMIYSASKSESISL